MLFTNPLLAEDMNVKNEPKGIIGRSYENGFPIIWKFVNEFPANDIRSKLQWLTVISWKYSDKDNNGMPNTETNQKMIDLEVAIEENIESSGKCQHAYSRTGNNLKELVYYINSRDEFLERFNMALKTHVRYPIEINFYEDKNWEDFQRILTLFNKNNGEQKH